MSGTRGMTKCAPMQERHARSRMWQSMRILRRFTAADLQAAGEVGASHAQKYLRGLTEAGYLRVVQPRRSGYTGGHTIYQLVRDTGPYAPRLGKQAVRDPNIEPTAKEPTVTIPRSEYVRALRCIHFTRKVRDEDLAFDFRDQADAALRELAHALISSPARHAPAAQPEVAELTPAAGESASYSSDAIPPTRRRKRPSHSHRRHS